MLRVFQAAVSPLLPPSPSAHFFVCGAEGILVRSADPPAGMRLPTSAEVAALGLELHAGAAHYLGRLGEDDCFALGLPPETVLPAGFSVRSLRKLYGGLPEDLFAVAGRAVQIVLWDETHRYCGRCATALLRQEQERAKRCPAPACGLVAFPRLSPAVIVLVRRGPQALLGRSPRFPAGVYSTLAGFVEPGETLEQAVAREIFEESGIHVQNVRYFGSQPWPFPHSLMIAFFAEYAGGELRVDGEEIVDARWFDPDALPQLPPPLSIARQLINTWLAEQDPAQRSDSRSLV